VLSAESAPGSTNTPISRTSPRACAECSRLRRFIAREVETRIGRALLSGDVPEGSLIRIDVEEGDIVVSHEAAANEAAA
jgi:hypothetical protein